MFGDAQFVGNLEDVEDPPIGREFQPGKFKLLRRAHGPALLLHEVHLARKCQGNFRFGSVVEVFLDRLRGFAGGA